MGQGRRIRVLLLLLLTLSSAFPTGEAQDAPPTQGAQPAICFDTDEDVGADGDITTGACRGDEMANYVEGSSVSIDIEAFAGVPLWVSVRCIAGCPAADPTSANVYWATYRGEPLLFPRDFVERGDDGRGANAPADKAPRYNSTWDVVAHVTGAPVNRPFHVWLYDAFAEYSTGLAIRPGESHMIRSSGMTPGADATIRWERRDPVTGRYNTVSTENRRISNFGTSVGAVEVPFRMPPMEARNISLCGRGLLDCYRLSVSGPGKEPETIPVQVGLAEIRRSNLTTPRPDPGAPEPVLQRTQNVTFDVDLNYPGGRAVAGPKLQPNDLPLNPAFQERALRVAVEKVYPNLTVFSIDEVPLAYAPLAFVWRAQWTIPKDLPIEVDARYRLRLIEQRDLYGNIVAEDILGNFTVEEAEMRPTLLSMPDVLERTEEGVVRLAVRYHNGSSFTPNDSTPPGNESPLRGCFLRVAESPPAPAPPPPRLNQCTQDDPLVWGKYYEGGWNFTIRYPRDHAELGPYRFVLVNNTVDRYGNAFLGLGTNDFQLIPAKPVVTFSTVMRGEEAEVLERGMRVFVSATIQYHDGSPYNHLVRVDPNASTSSTLSGRLVRRGPSPDGGYGAIAGDDVFNLTESDPSVGRWSGTLQLTDDDSATPAGIWTFLFDVADNLTVPNANSTAFDREIVSSTVVLCPTQQPPASAATGTSIRFRFRLFYSECDTGREVSEASLLGRLSARVHRFDTARQAISGEPVSEMLVPTYARDSTQDWGLEYEIADGLYAGSYVFALTGSDTFGNKLLPSSRSRPFSTFTEVVERAVIAQPPLELERGETATVVFDAREGDTGVDPTRPAPRIQLERFDATARNCEGAFDAGGCWVRERSDVRVPDPTFQDHLGVFLVSMDTPVGIYRFSLQGRDARYHIVTGLSENFTVNPTQVTRAFLATPPEAIVKGVPFTFYLEEFPGDKITDRITFLDGRLINLPNPQIRSEFGRVNVTWAIPFEAPAGNYTIRFDGKDVSGNDILVLTPPIEALSATLEGRLLGQPLRNIQRGETARVQFAVGYPDGTFYAAQDSPRVLVRNATSVVATATIRREGLTFAAEWRPETATPIGEYYFEVNPQATGATGNAFPPLRSSTFRVVPGAILRPAVDQVKPAIDRLEANSYSARFEPDDKFVAFDLVYYGPELSTAIDTTVPLIEITRSPLPHTIDAAGGKYVARVVTDQQSQIGTFKIIMTGEDAHGNRIVSESRQFVIGPTTVLVQTVSAPPPDAFGESKELTFTFTTKYIIGTVMDDSYGRPSVALLYAEPGGSERPATPRPEIEYLGGHWYMTWTAPENLPPGTYTFVVGGFDANGNYIANSRLAPYTVAVPSVPESFMKVIPGPSPILLALVAIAVALVVLRRQKRDE